MESQNLENSGTTITELDCEYETGQDNVHIWGLDVHNPVFPIASLSTIVFVVFTVLFQQEAARTFSNLRVLLTIQFDWIFLLSANVSVLVCFFLTISPLAKIRIGGINATPDYSYLSWCSMMFAAGIGIGLMFYGVLEPLTHTLNPPLGIDPADTELAREVAMSATIYHWSLHAWAFYALVGLALAISYYNKGLPFTVRSAFYPILGKKTWDWPGHIIDILAVFATLFGLATSLGLGAEQISAGLNYLFNIPDTVTTSVFLIVGITAIALISVCKGLNKGVKRLSEINICIATLFLLFVILVGSPLDFLNKIMTNTVNYIRYLPVLSNWIAREDTQFIHDWTTFYWAWWIAWSPFVGMFIARISNGRSVREFLICTLLIPSAVTVLWMSAFGSLAIDQYMQGYTEVVKIVNNWAPELALFKFLQPLPFPGLTSAVGICLIIIFFVTSMDSGSLVIDTITAGGKVAVPMIQRAFWCCFEGLVAIALLLGGGLASLQALSIASGFPLCILLLLMTICLVKGLNTEQRN